MESKMEVITMCVHCNHVIPSDNIVTTDPTFAELVNNCKDKQHNFDKEYEQLGKQGVLKWLLTHATDIAIDLLEVDKIVEQCCNVRKEADMIEILEKYKVYVRPEVFYRSEYQVERKHALLYAKEHGNPPEIITWLLKHIINDKERDKYNYTVSSKIVNEAIAAGQLNNVKAMENLGCVIEMPHDDSPWQIAAKNGHLHIIKWLYENYKNYVKKTPYSGDKIDLALYLAFKNSHYHVVEYLIENTDVNINYRCSWRIEQLIVHAAANLNNVNILMYLVDKKANLFAKCENNVTVVDIAVEKGNLNMLKWVLTQAVNQQILKPSLLHKAALNGHYDCVEYLVHKNMNVESVDEEGKSVLYHAVQSGNVKIVIFLLAHGVNIHLSKEHQDKLMLNAHESLEMIKFLISQGFDLKATNSDYETVLSLAARSNNYDAVQWLLEQGMLVTEVVKHTNCWLQKTSEDNCRLLLLCMKYMKDAFLKFDIPSLHTALSYPQALKAMLEHNYGEESFLGRLGGKLLIDALDPKTCEKSYQAAYYLLDHGADIKFKGEDKKTALYNAISSQNMSLIKKLVELGSDVNAEADCVDRTILYRAVKKGNMEIVKYIVEKGANIHATNRRGENVISIAASRCKWDIVKYFVELGVNINNGDPILYKAKYLTKNDVELISWLLNHGADPNKQGNNIHLILEEMMSLKNENKKLQLVKLLIEHGANVNTFNEMYPTVLFHCLNSVDIVEYLIGVGINVNAKNHVEHTALHALLEAKDFQENIQNYIKVAFKLIDNGADVNSLSRRKETPLHYAVRNSNCETIVRYLIAKGSDINARNWVGNSVLHVTRDVNIAMMLIREGADVNVRGKKGATLLKYVFKPKRYPRIFDKGSSIMPHLQNRVISNNDTKQSITDHYVKSIKYSRYIDFVVYLIGIADVSHVQESEIFAFATYHDSLRILKASLQNGLDILTTNQEGNNVLHLAADRSSINIVTYVLENMKHKLLFKGNNKNETPLHTAVYPECIQNIYYNPSRMYATIRLNSINVIKLLLKNGIDVNHKTKKGLTALDIARTNKQFEIVKLLEDHITNN